MAISVKSMNGLAAIKKIGIPPDLYDWLAASPVKVQLTAKEFRFLAPWPGKPDSQYSVAVSLNQLQQLSAGTLPAAIRATLSHKLTAALEAIRNQHAGLYADAQSAAAPDLGPGWVPLDAAVKGTLDALPPIPSAEPPPAAEAKPAWPEFDLSQLQTATPVKLRDATQMYQPVKGTSAGSRYFMVAANKDVRIAARCHGTSLSVRVEGPNLAKYTAQMATVGLSLKKDYASLHLEVGEDETMAGKTLGAILLGLGIPLETPVPNLKTIKV